MDRALPYDGETFAPKAIETHFNGYPFKDHLFPAIGEEPFNLSAAEMAEAWQSSEPPVNEAQASQRFQSIFASKFRLVPEVWMKHHTGQRLRIDFVGIDRTKTIAEPIGFELKKGSTSSEDFGSFTCALRQSVDYSKSVIDDARAEVYAGHQLRMVFVFPCLYQVYEADNSKYRCSYRDLWAQGELKLASESGVGAIHYVKRKRQWAFFLGGHPAWWHDSGWTELAKKHSRSKNVGSAA